MAYGQTLVSILLEPQLRVSTHSVFFSTQITSDMVKSERNSPERRWRNIRLLPECPRKVRCTVEAAVLGLSLIHILAGCGALGDLGSHLLSISQFIMGDITKVNAVATTVFPKRPKSAGSTEMVDVENEDIMTFMAEYANGAIGQIACGR